MKNHDDWFKQQSKSMLKSFGLIWAIMALIWLSAAIGIIYFILWCLKHFGVIGG